MHDTKRSSWLSTFADYSCGTAPDFWACIPVTGFAFKPSHPGERRLIRLSEL